MATYQFECDLGIFAIKNTLDAAGPWEWRANDSDSLGFYLSTRAKVRPDVPGASSTRLRIVEEGPSFLIGVDYCPDMPDSILTYEQLNKIVLEKLLPAIGARNIRPGSGID